MSEPIKNFTIVADKMFLNPDIKQYDEDLSREEIDLLFYSKGSQIRVWYKQSKLLQSKRFKGFDLNNSEISDRIKKNITKYLSNLPDMFKNGYGFYFWSKEPGTGKTTMLTYIVRELVKQGYSVYCESLVEIKKKLKQEFDSKVENPLLDRIKSVDVLSIDDIGSEKGSGWLSEVMKDIIDDRYNNCKVLMLTSNYPMNELPFDDKIKDRLNSMCHPIKFGSKSFRKLGI
jgi:DNA replication protein DnaC